MEAFRSSWLSADGELLNLTWNDTSLEEQHGPIMEWDDAAWVLAASFIIFSMQTGIICIGIHAMPNINIL